MLKMLNDSIISTVFAESTPTGRRNFTRYKVLRCWTWCGLSTAQSNPTHAVINTWRRGIHLRKHYSPSAHDKGPQQGEPRDEPVRQHELQQESSSRTAVEEERKPVYVSVAWLDFVKEGLGRTVTREVVHKQVVLFGSSGSESHPEQAGVGELAGVSIAEEQICVRYNISARCSREC